MTEVDSQDEPEENLTVVQRSAVLLSMVVLLAALVCYAVLAAWMARPGTDTSWWRRAPFLAVSALSVGIALCLAVALLRRKLKTGRFLLTQAALEARQAEYRSKTGAGKPFWPQARFWAVPFLLMLMFGTLGIVALAAAFTPCDCEPLSSRVPLLLIAALTLFVPGLFTFKAIRRKIRTGSFLPSQQELDKSRAKCAQSQSLQQRIQMAGLWSLIALGWTGSALFHTHRHASALGESWFMAAIWWVNAAIWITQIFWPSRSQCDLSGAREDSGLISIFPRNPQPPPNVE